MNSFFFKPALHVCCFKFSKVQVLDGQAIFPDFFSQIFPLFCVILAGFVCQRIQKSFKFQRDRDAKKQEYPKVGKAVCYTPQSPSAPISALLKVYGPARILYQCAVLKMRDQQKHDMVTPQINIVFEEVLLCPVWLL